MAAIALFGVVAYRALPVSDLPQVDYPTLNVSAGLPGGDPGTMASAVASPLERQFTTIAGLDAMTSSSGTGSTNITLQFDLDRDIDSAAVDVQTAIAAVMPLLPAGMPSPPSFRKNNPADQPILMLNLTSNTLPMSALDDYAETMIAPRISMVSGVSQVQVQGASKYAVRVQVDPDKLHAAAHRPQRSRSGAAELERQPADRAAVRPDVDLQHQGGRPADERRRRSGRSSSPTATARRSGSIRSPTSSTASRTSATAAWFYTKDGTASRRCSARSRCR